MGGGENSGTSGNFGRLDCSEGALKLKSDFDCAARGGGAGEAAGMKDGCEVFAEFVLPFRNDGSSSIPDVLRRFFEPGS